MENILPRREARENAFLLAFSQTFGDVPLREALLNNTEDEEHPVDVFGKRLLNAYYDHSAEVDDLISSHLRNWTMSRLPRVSLTVLRLALAEMLYGDEKKVGVVINEAVELTKKYGAGSGHCQRCSVRRAVSRYTLGIDTSNYATSLAVFDTAGEVVCAKKRFLPVKEGQLGLRQSDALFHHTTALPEMLEELSREFDLTQIAAVGVSQKPRPVEGSYMPCFLAGVSAATAFARARGIPLVHTTHQQGHAAAALFAAKGEELFRRKVLLFHISGGTTDLLLCDEVRQITTLGTSSDLYAGQAVDRVGVKLGFPFPAGAEVSRLAALCEEPIRPKSSVKGMTCSLSGLENQCNALLQAGKSPEYVCKYCLLCVADTVVRMTKAAQKDYPGLPVVCAGGVMSSDIIRVWVQQRLPQVYFVPGRYSSDNAIGVSILAAREAGLWLK